MTLRPDYGHVWHCDDVLCDSRFLDKISAATRALRNVFLKDFSHHLGPRIIGYFGVLPILSVVCFLPILSVVSKLKSFLFIWSKDNVPSEWGVWGEDSSPSPARQTRHLTR